MSFDRIAIVGVGLIGGSVGLAIAARGIGKSIVGVGREGEDLSRAVQLGAIGEWNRDLGAAVRDADLIVVCTPVDRIAEIVLHAAPYCAPGAIFTDGGSAKGSIVAAVRGKLPASVSFVPAHPLAGSEKSGVENARLDLFENKTTIVTPVEGSDEAAVEAAIRFWQSLGSHVVRMAPEDHDRAVAITSHLPHALAAAAAGITSRDLLALTAGGFRDVTRIAAGNPALWAAIFTANRQAVLNALDGFTDRMAQFRRMLEADDRTGIVDWLTEAKQVRDALGC